MGQMTITPEALALSGHKFRKELLQMPVHAMQETVQHMTVRRGIRYAETVGELTGDDLTQTKIMATIAGGGEQ